MPAHTSGPYILWITIPKGIFLINEQHTSHLFVLFTSHMYILCCAITRPHVLATGDASGVVKVWRLSTELTMQGSKDEMELLNSLALQTVVNTSL